MTTIETIKYQNDYTGEVFDNYEECFNSEAEFMFNKDSSGIVAVFDNGRIGNITEVFDSSLPSGLDAYRINAIICSSEKAAHNFINNFKSYWYNVDGTRPKPFDADVCNNDNPDTLIFIPSINADDENYPAFICVADAKMIIHSFRQDMKFAEKAKRMVDNSNKV